MFYQSFYIFVATSQYIYVATYFAADVSAPWRGLGKLHQPQSAFHGAGRMPTPQEKLLMVGWARQSSQLAQDLDLGGWQGRQFFWSLAYG